MLGCAACIFTSFAGLVLKDREFFVAGKLDVAVVRGRKLGNDHLEAGAVGGHPGTGEQLLPVQSIDPRQQIRGALDERHEGAHAERDTALREIPADAVERREQPELLVRASSSALVPAGS
jgi:hypothetical protein